MCSAVGSPEAFKPTVSCVRSELPRTGFHKLRAKLSAILLSRPPVQI